MLRKDFHMNCMAWLWLLGLVAQASLCPQHCRQVEDFYPTKVQPMGQHHSRSSVVPWTIFTENNPSREPQLLRKAQCGNCSLLGWTAMPIEVQVKVYYRQDTHTQNRLWCECPCSLPVACTCVQPGTRTRPTRQC